MATVATMNVVSGSEARTTDLLSVIVRGKRRETPGIVSLELTRPDSVPLPPFEAGAHVDVHLPGGITRQYSLCNDPKERHRYVIAILREPESRGGSVLMHDRIQDGDILNISPPRNHFALAENASSTLLFAGGIGVTPLLAMAERLSDLNANFQLHYCARKPELMAFRNRLERARFADRTHMHFDNGPESQRLDVDALLAYPPDSAHLYVCGPAGFIDHVIARARADGWTDRQIHREYFTAPQHDLVSGDAFKVKIASTGVTVHIPDGCSVVEALARAGIDIPVACEQGVCGTCLTGVLEGQIEHRDFFLTQEERDAGRQFTPCCSRGKGLVILDL